MRIVSRYLYDNLDKKYERKNLYLREIATLQEENKGETKGGKHRLDKSLEKIRKNKSYNKYLKKLNDFKKSERLFLKELEEKVSKIKVTNGTLLKKINELEIRLFKAYEKQKFYNLYTELTYDAELIYKQTKIEIEQIPQVIEFAIKRKKELEEAKSFLEKISLEEENLFNEELKKYKLNQKELLKGNINAVKFKANEGLISVSYTHLTLPTTIELCRSRWSPYH